MATNNFAIPNASRYYAFGMNKYITQDDIDANDLDQDCLGEFDWDQTQCDFEYTLSDCKSKLLSLGWHEDEGTDGDRNYCGSYFAYKYKWVEVAGVQCKVSIRAKCVSAYYEGATFDYDFNPLQVIDRNGYYIGPEYDLLGDYEVDEESVIDDDWCCNRGLSKIHAKRIISKINEAKKALIDEAENAFSYACEHELVKIWQGSNGEAGYGPASNRRCQLKAAILSVS